MRTIALRDDVPGWATGLDRPARYKGAKGGRASGKSHRFAEKLVFAMIEDPSLRAVCIREVQRSLRYSAKSLIEAKIRAWGLEGVLFKILSTEIRRIGGSGVCIFQGMQDHTADSLKSLEDFGIAWVEEAHRLSKRSLELLLPTIRREGSEIWFSWNPEDPADPVDALFAGFVPGRDDFELVHVNYTENPFVPDVVLAEAERLKRVDPQGYAHVWLGEYNLSPKAQVLHGKWRVDEFEPDEDLWDGPYFGFDFGFSQDPSVFVRCWLFEGRLLIDYDLGGIGWSVDDHIRAILAVPGAKDHVLRGDSARPETMNEIVIRARQDYGIELRLEGAEKWSGSVQDGVSWLRSTEEIVIHERCTRLQEEARLWRYKLDRLTGDPLPKLEDGHEHGWDATRYALAPIIRHGDGFEFWVA